MTNTNPLSAIDPRRTEPLCPVFGECGGCRFQHLPYARELRVKERYLRWLLRKNLRLADTVFEPAIASPEPYHYRHRLDMAFRRLRDGQFLMGFMPEGRKKILEIDACPIARREISDFLPALKQAAITKWPPKYRVANLVVRADQTGKVSWGGIGKRSLRMKPEEYFYAEVNGTRVYYSMETFFQANLFILPDLINTIESLAGFSGDKIFLDLYSGVGLFGLIFAKQAGQVLMIEENTWSIELARHNVRYHSLENVEILEGRVEDKLAEILPVTSSRPTIAMIDPPRAGLSPSVCEALTRQKHFESLFYLSCHPASLARDLERFTQAGWIIEKIIPLDFFPKTRHLETLVFLRPD